MAIEGNKGPTKAIVNVCLSSPATSTVTVDYATADGTATVADRDYQAKMGTVRFRAGETCRGITVSVKGDSAVEGPETFDVVLSDAVGATIGDGVGEVTIIDDDSLLMALFR
jgi:chitinase